MKKDLRIQTFRNIAKNVGGWSVTVATRGKGLQTIFRKEFENGVVLSRSFRVPGGDLFPPYFIDGLLDELFHCELHEAPIAVLRSRGRDVIDLEVWPWSAHTVLPPPVRTVDQTPASTGTAEA